MRNFLNKITIKHILIFSFLVHLIASYFSSGYHHSDEHYQIIEFLNAKINPNVIKDLPWEYQYKVRPWFQVFWYFGIYKVLNIFTNSSPFLLISILRFFTAMFSFYAFYRFQEIIRRWFPNLEDEKIATILFHLVWFLPYIQSRTSSENFGISFFLLGMVYFFRKDNFSLLASGLFLALAYLARTQMALMTATFWFWIVLFKQIDFKKIAIFTSAILFGILIGPLFDWWGYGELTFVPFNYYHANFSMGILDKNGIQPWYYYFNEIWLRSIPPLGFFIFLSLVYFVWKKRSHVLTFICVPFILFHIYLGHKELRFLFPIAPFLGIALAYIYSENKDYIFKIWNEYFIVRFLGKLSLTLNTLLLVWTIFTPANAYHHFYSYVFDHPEIKDMYFVGENPYWIGDLKLSFYKPEYLELLKIEDKKMIMTSHYHFFTNDSKLAVDIMKDNKCALLYTSYPKWMYQKLMFIRGFARTRAWALFECQD